MSRASTKTKLSLSRWAQIFGMHPLHFNQVELQTDVHCDHIYFQYEWQTADHVSREEIARAIAESEYKIERELGFHLAPEWEVDEWKPTTRINRAQDWNYMPGDIRGYRQSVRANWGYFIAGGVEAKELLDAGAAIIYTDVDGDGYKERATVQVTGTVGSKDEVCIFYPGHDGDDGWEIRPIEVVVTGTTIDIVFRRELVIAEHFYDMFDVSEDSSADALDDADFLETIDVYRRYNDPQTQATFLWEPLAGRFCGACSGAGCQACAYGTQNGCLIVRGDPRQSILGYAPATWSVDDSDFSHATWAVSRQPDIVRLYYYSGWQQKRLRYPNRMDPEWEIIVAHMAAAQLDRPPCDCAKGDWSRWRQDLTLIAGDDDADAFYRDPSGLLGHSIQDNPFGSRRGEVEAWRKVCRMKTGSAILL